MNAIFQFDVAAVPVGASPRSPLHHDMQKRKSRLEPISRFDTRQLLYCSRLA
jgi:hypothetical protein